MNINFQGAYKLVYQQLEKLDKNLYYHGRHHTFEDVLPNSILLCKEEKLNEIDTLIVKTAALFHDTGFLDVYNKNEPNGCERAKKYLPQFGYTKEMIKKICDCIMATQLPQSPKNLLSEIVCDADLGHLGTFKYFLRSEALRLELNLVKKASISLKDWNKTNIEFLEKHSYFTKAAEKLFNKEKLNNIKLIKE